MILLDSLDWSKVKDHYKERVCVHEELLELLASSSAGKFANLALENRANYSAFENGLKDKILGANPDAERRIVALANEFVEIKDAHEVPTRIENSGIKFLKVGVGSELSCMVNPKACWVANTRTLWSYFAVNNGGNLAEANEQLSLYRQNDGDSKMAFQKWAALHGIMDGSLRELGQLGSDLARRAKIEPGELTYLWADAIATSFYANYHRIKG